MTDNNLLTPFVNK